MQEPHRNTVASLSKIYQTGVGKKNIGQKTFVKEKTTNLPLSPENGADLKYAGDERSRADKGCEGEGYRQKKKRDKSSVAENLTRGSTATRLNWMEVVSLMTTTMGPTGSRVEAIAAKQRPTDENPDEIETPTRMFSVESRPPRYPNAQTNEVVVVTPIQTVTSIAREDARANFW